MDSLRNVGALVGRILLAFIFVDAGIEKLLNPARTMHYMEAAGMHQAVGLLFVIAVIVELIGGLMLVVGWQTEWAALVIFLFCIPVTVIFHVIPGQIIQWHKNLAFMGGLLVLAVHGAGGISIDGLRKAGSTVATRAAARHQRIAADRRRRRLNPETRTGAARPKAMPRPSCSARVRATDAPAQPAPLSPPLAIRRFGKARARCRIRRRICR